MTLLLAKEKVMSKYVLHVHVNAETDRAFLDAVNDSVRQIKEELIMKGKTPEILDGRDLAEKSSWQYKVQIVKQ